MKKAIVNYWVDLATAVALVLCAATGILFLLPAGMTTSFANGKLTMLAMSVPLLRSIHDWSGVAMVAGVGVHLALHARWIGKMTRRVAAGAGSTAGRQPAAARPRATVTAAHSSAGARAPDTMPSPEATRVPQAGRSGDDLERARQRAERLRDRDRRYTRKGFLQGSAAAGAAALLLGAGLFELGRGASPTAGAATTAGAGSTPAAGASSAGSGTTTTTVSSPVVIAASSCVSCGRCLEVCVHGALGWGSNGRASVQHPASCTRCGRCVPVCPVRAITLTA